VISSGGEGYGYGVRWAMSGGENLIPMLGERWTRIAEAAY
jgi:hypothetical protein